MLTPENLAEQPLWNLSSSSVCRNTRAWLQLAWCYLPRAFWCLSTWRHQLVYQMFINQPPRQTLFKVLGTKLHPQQDIIKLTAWQGCTSQEWMYHNFIVLLCLSHAMHRLWGKPLSTLHTLGTGLELSTGWLWCSHLTIDIGQVVLVLVGAFKEGRAFRP